MGNAEDECIVRTRQAPSTRSREAVNGGGGIWGEGEGWVCGEVESWINSDVVDGQICAATTLEPAWFVCGDETEEGLDELDFDVVSGMVEDTAK